jgi:hypothetical protein
MPKEFILTLIIYISIGVGISTIIGGIIGGVATASWLLFIILAIIGSISIAIGAALDENKTSVLRHWDSK